MNDNPGDVMTYLYIAGPVLFLLAAATSALVRRWRIRTIARRRYQTRQAIRARRPHRDPGAAAPRPALDRDATAASEALADVDRRIEAAFAALDDFKTALDPDGVGARR